MAKQNKKNGNVALTGGASAAKALAQIRPDVMAAYPITPQTPIIETFAKYKANGKVDTEIIPVESEHSAMSACIGASSAGARTVTATSSQGLALMNEVLYIASGLRLPILMLVSARALSAPINIHGDHSDVMGCRDAGWIQIYSSNAQDVYNNTLIGLKLAESVQIPVMVIMDGFTTSHSVENLEVLKDDQVQHFVREFNPENYLLNLENPVTYGPVGLPDSYFNFKIDQESAFTNSIKELRSINNYFNEKFYHYNDVIDRYETEDAEYVLIVAGSTADTAKDVVDELRLEGQKVGLINIKLYRPFPFAEVADVLKKVKSFAVMDRAISFGAKAPLFSDMIDACCMFKITCPRSNYIYGLGGRDIFPKHIRIIFEDLIAGKVYQENRYIGEGL